MPFSLHGTMKFLADFLNQAHSGEQAVVRRYPTEFAGLRVRVSFGRGIPAHVPWIAFLADGMEVRDGYYPVYLYYKENEKLVLCFGFSEENQHHREWGADILMVSRACIRSFKTRIVMEIAMCTKFMTCVSKTASGKFAMGISKFRKKN